MDFKVKIIENETEEDRMLNSLLTSPVREKFVEIGEEKFVLPIYFTENWESDVNKFEVLDDDVFLLGHPKTGTTWLHEIVDLIVHGVHTKDINTDRMRRQLFLDFPIIFNLEVASQHFPFFNIMMKALHEEKSPRCIRTHLPWCLLPEQIRNGTRSPKMICVLRNPKDTCVSFYHYNRLMGGFTGTFEEFSRLFLAGRLHYGPFLKNIKTHWEKRNEHKILFVKYSDLKKDLPGMINKMATFLEKPLSESEVQALAEHASVDNMKKNVGKQTTEQVLKFAKTFDTFVAHSDFVRAGKEGGYDSIMSEELAQKFDKFTEKELEGTGLSF
ncbi:hypothetical protein ILUMI_24374 [Ignelater luminosus]|uniref:Sulfotransferase domain-containing protein n=1 Tax=Ignelater luminosus TaxID=2038154 RepID=A0A8K0G0Z4_IGNLU|nr:hypothetical protein ILUMI_24374 [Ignelater luminosus]